MRDTITVTVQAIACQKTADGLYTLTLPARELTSHEDAVLIELFPNLRHHVDKLLAKECMIDAM